MTLCLFRRNLTRPLENTDEQRFPDNPPPPSRTPPVTHSPRPPRTIYAPRSTPSPITQQTTNAKAPPTAQPTPTTTHPPRRKLPPHHQADPTRPPPPAWPPPTSRHPATAPPPRWQGRLNDRDPVGAPPRRDAPGRPPRRTQPDPHQGETQPAHRPYLAAVAWPPLPDRSCLSPPPPRRPCHGGPRLSLFLPVPLPRRPLPGRRPPDRASRALGSLSGVAAPTSAGYPLTAPPGRRPPAGLMSPVPTRRTLPRHPHRLGTGPVGIHPDELRTPRHARSGRHFNPRRTTPLVAPPGWRQPTRCPPRRPPPPCRQPCLDGHHRAPQQARSNRRPSPRRKPWSAAPPGRTSLVRRCLGGRNPSVAPPGGDLLGRPPVVLRSSPPADGPPPITVGPSRSARHGRPVAVGRAGGVGCPCARTGGCSRLRARHRLRAARRARGAAADEVAVTSLMSCYSSGNITTRGALSGNSYAIIFPLIAICASQATKGRFIAIEMAECTGERPLTPAPSQPARTTDGALKMPCTRY
ncbi:hypothetical protein SAMN05421874_110115 [Nonomuraea maritima]|uniref:Uncharacterized protein n=1 Tax=Nonomuraea maritima TaxID=683260 RepID=A0A1G9E3K2_9ACTN|nr:hypothetical protein SAMN05421874_110115 [Nonomuraea maritima]